MAGDLYQNGKEVRWRHQRLRDVVLGLVAGVVLMMAFTSGTSHPPAETFPASPEPRVVETPKPEARVQVAAKAETAALPDDLIYSLSAEGLGLDPAKVAKVLDTHWWELPCRGDTENMLPLLRLAYRTQVKRGPAITERATDRRRPRLVPRCRIRCA